MIVRWALESMGDCQIHMYMYMYCKWTEQPTPISWSVFVGSRLQFSRFSKISDTGNIITARRDKNQYRHN